MFCLLFLLATRFVPLVTGSIDNPDVFVSATFVWTHPAERMAACSQNNGIRRVPTHWDKHLMSRCENLERPYESTLCELKATRDDDCKALWDAFTKSEQTLLQKRTDFHCEVGDLDKRVFVNIQRQKKPRTAHALPSSFGYVLRPTRHWQY